MAGPWGARSGSKGPLPSVAVCSYGCTAMLLKLRQGHGTPSWFPDHGEDLWEAYKVNFTRNRVALHLQQSAYNVRPAV